MIIFVDLQHDPADVWMLEEGIPQVSVHVGGESRIADLDRVMATTGIGRAVGHHAEVAVDWLLTQWSSLTPEGAPGAPPCCCPWLRHDRLDQTRSWLAAPIEWDDPHNQAYRRSVARTRRVRVRLD